MHISSTSIDQREVEHFKSIAHTWWDPKGPFWPLHTLNKLRMAWILTQLKKHRLCSDGPSALAGLKVLDVGCGGGILSEALAEQGAEVTGLDVVEKNLAIAKTHAENSQLDINYQCLSVEELAQTEQHFDVVFNMEVVEHVADLNSFMTACSALVKPGGHTFIATINRNWLAWLVTIVGAEYVLQWLPKGTHHYSMLRTPKEITELLTRDRFDILHSAGVKVNPFTKRMSIVSSKRINYMLHAKNLYNPR